MTDMQQTSAPVVGDPVIRATNVTRRYKDLIAVDRASFDVHSGSILGVIGANGAGKTTLLNALLGLIRADGEISVFGHDPFRERAKIMQDVCFISDVATLPRWMKVEQVLDYVEGVHPKFVREKALSYLTKTSIPLTKKVKGLSKGMVTQLHLALVMAIDARLLVLDEPTLGLDIIFRKNFYADLIGEYFDEDRTIIITTHQVEEIEHILTDVLFIREGRINLMAPMEQLAEQFTQVVTETSGADAARTHGPIHERSALGRTAFVFENADKNKLAELGEVRPLGLADLFVAKMTGAEK